MLWPDIVIVVIVALLTLKGLRRGFILELSGAVALAASIAAPWFYNGAFDTTIASATHVGTGVAHVIAMFLVGAGAYLAVLIFARILTRVSKAVFLGSANALAGAAVGLVKGLVLLWIALYVALFFPLSPQIRRDLHRSTAVAIITRPNGAVDQRIIATLPWFARPYVYPLFARHRV